MAGSTIESDVRVVRAIVGALRASDMSGFEIWRWLGTVHGSAGGALDQASLYPTLYRLEAEGIVKGSWREDTQETRSRRTYRLTVKGLNEAQSRGWGPVAYRRGPADRAASSDSEEGWTWTEPVGGEEADPIDVLATYWNGGKAESADEILVEDYLERFQRATRLSGFHCNDVCHEISDHVAASASRLRTEDCEPLEAAEKSLAALGPPEQLAHDIDLAQLTPDRLQGGLRWASGPATFVTLVAAILVFGALELLVPILGSLIVGLAPALGLHLYAPDLASWHAQRLGMAACVGAFLGARVSLPDLASRSRRAEPFVRSIWALTGAIPLGLMVLFVPASYDPLAVAALLAVPIAWIAGTLRPLASGGVLIPLRWRVIGAAILLTLSFTPGMRVWSYDPSATPEGAAAYSGDVSTITWVARTDGIWQFQLPLPDGWTDPALELRPVLFSGLTVTPDLGSAGEVIVTGTDRIDPAQLQGATDWWVTATAVGPDGRRHVIAVSLRKRVRDHYYGTLLGWLLGAR